MKQKSKVNTIISLVAVLLIAGFYLFQNFGPGHKGSDAANSSMSSASQSSGTTAKSNGSKSSGSRASSAASSGNSASSGKAGTSASETFTGANPSDLAEIRESALPPQGRETLALIRKGGPYPNSRDGINFGNFENRLPRESSGYYREFTVATPGASTRGAKRIIVGKGGAKYFTADHYETFTFIVEGK